MYLFLNICRWFFKCDIRHGCWDDEKETEDKQRLRKGKVAQKDVSAVVSVGQPRDSSHVQHSGWSRVPISNKKNESILLLTLLQLFLLTVSLHTQLKQHQQYPLLVSPTNQLYSVSEPMLPSVAQKPPECKVLFAGSTMNRLVASQVG